MKRTNALLGAILAATLSYSPCQAQDSGALPPGADATIRAVMLQVHEAVGQIQKAIGEDLGSVHEGYAESKQYGLLQDPVVLPIGHMKDVIKDNKVLNYYVLVLPVNIGRTKQKEAVIGFVLKWWKKDHPRSYPDNFTVESIYPTHQYLSEQYEHSNQLGASLSPQFAGFGAGSVSWQGTWKTSYGFDVPKLIGTLVPKGSTGVEDNVVLWNYLRQGKQLIDPGTIAFFTTFSTTTDLSEGDAPHLLVGCAMVDPAHKKPLASTLKASVRVVTKEAAQNYINLHQAELPTGSLALLKALVMPSKDDSVKADLNIKLQKVTELPHKPESGE